MSGTVNRSLADPRPTRKRTHAARVLELREFMDARELIKTIKDAADEMQRIYRKIKRAQVYKAKMGQDSILKPKDVELQLYALRTAMDVQKTIVDTSLKQLRFTMPELKAVALEDGDGANPFEGLAQVLAEALDAVGA